MDEERTGPPALSREIKVCCLLSLAEAALVVQAAKRLGVRTAILIHDGIIEKAMQVLK